MKSLFLGDLTRDLRYDSNKHENGNKHRPCRLVVTLFVQPSRKWQTVILCICCLLLDCSCKNVNGCHELEIFCFFFLISSAFGINQSEVGFHLLCCDTRQCQNKSCLLLFSIRLGYKLCNIYQQRRSIFTLSEELQSNSDDSQSYGHLSALFSTSGVIWFQIVNNTE